jgi:conjugal transfer pilus assembly protein TraD
MLTHHYEHWYTQLFGLSSLQWYALLAASGTAAAFSLLKPEFFRIVIESAARRTKRSIVQMFVSQKTDEQGIVIAGMFIPDSARLRHTHIVGATGCGKTVLLEQLIYEDIARGHGALIIDPKGDRELYHRVRNFCRAIGREKDLHLLSATWPSESVRWNPCAIGSASELQSKWFSSGVYREPFYAKACELALLKAFIALLDDKKTGFTLADLLDQVEKQSEDGKDKNVQGLHLDLQAFAKSEWGPLFGVNPKGGPDDRPLMSLLQITSKNQILFVDLPTEAKAVQSARVGKLLLQELMLVSGLRKLHPHLKSQRPFSVFIDEFDAFATENFATFQNKGRSSDFMIHLAHQTLSDLERVSPPFKGQILGNCNVRFIFRQDVPEDAETWAKFLGTKRSIKQTFQKESGVSTGRSSNREAEEFRIHPNHIKELKTGTCVFSMKSDGKLCELKIPFPPKLPKPRIVQLERVPHAPSTPFAGAFNISEEAEASILDEAMRKGDGGDEDDQNR